MSNMKVLMIGRNGGSSDIENIHTSTHTNKTFKLQPLWFSRELNVGYLFLFIHIDTNNLRLKVPAHIKQSFSGKYPYHKVPDRKHSGLQQDLKALKSWQRYQTLQADWQLKYVFKKNILLLL